MSIMAKRVAKRRIKRLSITFTEGKVEYTGMSSDFSSTGLFIRTRKAFNPGTPVKMVIEVDKNRKIELAGVVTRAIKTGVMDFKNGMGIKLSYIPQVYENFLKEIIN